MSTKRGYTRQSHHFRAVVRALLAEGKSLAAIVKATGKSYAHVKRIAEQEQAAQAEAAPCR